MNIHDQSVPNWFYYWTQSPIIQALLNSVPGLHLYDMNTCSFKSFPTPPSTFGVQFLATPVFNPNGSNTYGSNAFRSDNMMREDPFTINDPNSCDSANSPSRLVVTGYDNAAQINIGQGCGYYKARDNCNPSPVNRYEGIHVLYATTAHEIEHAIIECEVWNYTHPSDSTITAGYNTLWDMDHDGYKDVWEKKSQDASDYGFVVRDPNIYPDFSEDKYNGLYNNQSTTGACNLCETDTSDDKYCSAGTRFEEERCRTVEQNLILNVIDNEDWSFDPTNDVQGKQWR